MNIIFRQNKAGLFGELEKYKKLEKKIQEGPGFCFVKNQEHPKINQSSVKKDMNHILKEGFIMATYGTTEASKTV